jgi:diaminopimelate epimerase
MSTADQARGRKFWKMSGSGNDFVFLDGRTAGVTELETPEAIGRICSRTAGVGADGVVVIEPHATEQFSIRYFNRDGSRGELCGNASLCSSRLAVQLGFAKPDGFRFSTDVGPISGRVIGSEAEIDLQPPTGIRPDAAISLNAGERRIGFADTGVPHLVVLVDDAESVDLMARGAELRRHASLAAGANVNFVAPIRNQWRMRTYERGVEAETLACGTGSVASAVLLEVWGLAKSPVELRTTSGMLLTVSTGRATSGRPSLRGEGRLDFSGQLAEF